MARCTLDLDNPRFKKLIGDPPDQHLQAGLEELRGKVAKEHNISGWVNHRMKKFPAYQNKVWKWDLAPDDIHSSTRKGWRLLAYVEDPTAKEPIAQAFYIYSKNEDEGGNATPRIAKLLKAFLSEVIAEEEIFEEEKFVRHLRGDGETQTVCMKCLTLLGAALDLDEVTLMETEHIAAFHS